MQYVAQGSDEGGYVEDLVPEIVAEFSRGELISREHVEDEIDLMLRTIREFWNMEPDQVLLAISAIGARATEVGIHLHRLERKSSTWKQLRTMQIDKILLELISQFKVHSRIVELRRQDIQLSVR